MICLCVCVGGGGRGQAGGQLQKAHSKTIGTLSPKSNSLGGGIAQGSCFVTGVCVHLQMATVLACLCMCLVHTCACT